MGLQRLKPLVAGLAVALLGGWVTQGLAVVRPTPPPAATQAAPPVEEGTVEAVTVVAHGAGATARAQMGTVAGRVQGTHRRTVRVGRVTRSAVGSDARACLQIADEPGAPCTP